MFKIFNKQTLLTFAVLFTASSLMADAGLVTFDANTTAKASEVNANFITLENRITNNSNSINTNTTNIGLNMTAINTNSGDIASNSTNIGFNTGAISTNSGSAITNAADISTHTTNITTNTSKINSMGMTRTISVPSSAFAYNPSSTIITPFALGLMWTKNYENAATFAIKKPADYTGGNVIFNIFFESTTDNAGDVAFFIRPRSFDSGNLYEDVAAIQGTKVQISANRIVYTQTIYIDSSRMTKDWWYISIQREGHGDTYPDSVVVIGAALEYTIQ